MTKQHYYKLMIKNEVDALTIGPVEKINQSDKSYTFLDERGDIIAMLREELIDGIIRMPNNSPTLPQESASNVVDQRHFLHLNAGDKNGYLSQHPAKKELKTPVVDDPSDIIREPKIDGYTIKQNKDTSGYEVHIETAKQEITNGLAQASANVVKMPEQTPVRKKMVLRYRDITVRCEYDPITKETVVKKGSLMYKEPTSSLMKDPSKEGIRQKRKQVVRKSVEEYNHEYYRLSEDVVFTSLTQAGSVMTGSLVIASKQWHEEQLRRV